MFEVIKSNVDLKEVISKYANSEVVECGTNTYQLEDKSCPFCGHNDCFKVKDEESEEEPAFYKCFSCDETGDAIGFVGKLLSLTLREAALKIAKDF
ncbi:MAG: hypothetical protein JHC33_11375, partial [Ignisphaera sp.]|nr:hypothetical protein [Ignisphaera sp.]